MRTNATSVGRFLTPIHVLARGVATVTTRDRIRGCSVGVAFAAFMLELAPAIAPRGFGRVTLRSLYPALVVSRN
jgi:hypothetical protein